MTTQPGDPHPERAKTPARITRRGFGLLGVGALVGGSVFAVRWFNVTGRVGGDGTLSALNAHKAAQDGTMLLVDIRRPDEWLRTGIGEGAVPLDMRRADFTDALLLHTNGRMDVPVALICARGVRSKGLSRRLGDAGFSDIIDVPEGMLGSGAGPGWLRQGLPVVDWQEG